MSLRVSVGVLFAAVLILPVAGAAPWTQTSYDPARTGHVPASGPAWNDTALSLVLPGVVTTPASWGEIGLPAEPIIHDGRAFISVEPAQDGSGEAGVARVDLDAGEVQLFLSLDDPPRHLAVAQEQLLVATADGLSSYDLATGEERWTHPMEQELQETSGCFTLTVRANTVVAGCMRLEGGPGAQNPAPVIQALDVATGDELWVRPLDFQQWSNQRSETEPQDDGEQASLADTPGRRLTGVSIIGDRVYVTTLQSSAVALCEVRVPRDELPSACWMHRDNTMTVWALDAQREGEILWSNTTEPIEQRRLAVRDVGEADAYEGDPFAPFSPRVTGTPRTLYLKWDGTIQKLNPGQEGSVIWEVNLGQEDVAATQADCTVESCPPSFGGTSSALHADALYASSTQSLSRLDIEDHEIDWQVPIAFEERVAWGSLILADGWLYAMADGPGYGAIYALEAETGQELWRHELSWRAEAPDRQGDDQRTFTDNRSHRYGYAVGEGVLVAAGTDGSVHVIGKTEASLRPEVEASSTKPGVGEPVTVDLSGTEAGISGPATSFRADWGDGTTTAWTANSTLTHTYEEEGPHTARFWAANDENQTASTVQTFDVGATEPNMIETAFARENQDLTFGILGLLVALTGGVIGVGRRYRKRSRLQEELEALEEGFERTKENPGECEAFLDTRKARAQSLMLDGVLTEEQFGVIESRVEELGRRLRTSVLDERFQFLPYGLVQSLKKMLADGKISSWERDAVETLLDDEETLSEAQREKVRHQLDRWLVEDAGGGSA